MTLSSLFSSLLALVLKLISTSLLYPLGTFVTFVSAVIKFIKKILRTFKATIYYEKFIEPVVSLCKYKQCSVDLNLFKTSSLIRSCQYAPILLLGLEVC